MKLLPFLLLSFLGLAVNASSSATVPTNVDEIIKEISAPSIQRQSIRKRGAVGQFWERKQKLPSNGGAQSSKDSSKAVVDKPAGSLGKRVLAFVRGVFKPIFLPSVSEIGGKARGAVDNFLEHTLYSKENQPESNKHAEWSGFLSGWMLVAIPIPLSILVAVLCLNVAILLASSWEDAIKNKYLIGISHGTMVMLVLLRTLEETIDQDTLFVSPRVGMIGLNLATNLFFGHAGSYMITKYLMDSAIWTTMLYILFEYLR